MSYRYGATKINWFIKQIRSKDIVLSSVKSSGPWGQHVNKNETKIQLTRDVSASQVLPKVYIQRLIERNQAYITDSWILRIDTQVHRTQKVNKEQTYKKLVKIIKSAFKEEVIRKKSLPPKWAIDKRIAEKRKTSRTRKSRNKIVW